MPVSSMPPSRPLRNRPIEGDQDSAAGSDRDFGSKSPCPYADLSPVEPPAPHAAAERSPDSPAEGDDPPTAPWPNSLRVTVLALAGWDRPAGAGRALRPAAAAAPAADVGPAQRDPGPRPVLFPHRGP